LEQVIYVAGPALGRGVDFIVYLVEYMPARQAILAQHDGTDPDGHHWQDGKQELPAYGPG
jgi:hypothetical protein